MLAQLRQLGEGSAKRIDAGLGEPLSAIDGDALMAAVADAGLVLLRGFEGVLEDFHQLVAANSDRVTLDPSRKFHNKSAQLVDAGEGGIGLHSENANSPFRPDLIWFYCQTAARRGGATTYCDGANVWQEMNPSTRRLFEDHRISYHRAYPESMWKVYVAHQLDEPTDGLEISADHIAQVFRGVDGFEYQLRPDGFLETSYSCSAVSRGADGREAFANSLRGPYPGQTVKLENGSPIPPGVQEEIDDLYEDHLQEISWQDGDVAVIDNTRFLHGRSRILDPRRKIYASLSFLKNTEAAQ
ncbi:MAG: TauD/TfdA family dioxygenase [Thermoanaerobaculia bacterium]|nr:TauD/TfdA family dioxygenase [Thermoanaerobaculia bacterium]